ncbi:MAG: hypothetical protein KDN05_14365, partial [Verrucomicrobiae bacterium]|nr:hypothetical protein [Verrucomicrobiae bacterium]
MFRYLLPVLTAALASTSVADHSQYPPQRPARKTPAAAEGQYIVEPGNLRQTIRGFGFEIQSDSIASGNSG